MKRQDTGILGEKLARAYLEKRGFRILETNYRCPEGEVDIIAQEKDCLVFVEVRSKTSNGFGTPEESITKTKERQIIAAAQHYWQEQDDPPPLWRIDFVAVELDQSGKPSRIELIEHAIGEE
jgi:putative endonuclease